MLTLMNKKDCSNNAIWQKSKKRNGGRKVLGCQMSHKLTICMLSLSQFKKKWDKLITKK